MNLRKLTLSIAATGALLSLGSCSSDEPNSVTTTVYTDIVTVAQVNDGSTKFSFQEVDDSKTITLTTTQSIDKDAIKVGERVVISYRPASDTHYITDDITVFGMATCFGKGEEVPVGLASDNADWMTSSVRMNSVYRSGKYINIIFQATTSPDPKICKIVADETTIDSDYPELHFIFMPDNILASENYVMFVSYSIADLWDKESTKGIKVSYTDESGPHTETFVKSPSGFQPVPR